MHCTREVMLERDYKEIVRFLESNTFRRGSLQLVASQFPQIPEETLLSIYSQLIQLHTKRTHHCHRKPDVMEQYYQSYLVAREKESSDSVLLELADKVCLSPTLYARIILEQHTERNTSCTIAPTTPATTVSFTATTAATTCSIVTTTPTTVSSIVATTPTTVSSAVTTATTTATTSATTVSPTATTTATTGATTALVNQWIKNPHTIPDPTLQLHIKTCILHDTNYGPLANNIKRSVGYEYELLLTEKIKELNIPFLDEHGLRTRGYDKTPDVKLEVPVAVNGHVVNWIESKASFGDRNSHNKYMEEQFWSYHNRYGSGLVIYWFGFVAELNSYQDQGILLMERFPDPAEIVKLHTHTV